MRTERKNKAHLTVVQTEKVMTLLRQHCKQDDKGYAQYDEGWSDTLVAETVGCTSAAPIMRIRRELVGELRKGGSVGVSFRVDQLEKQVAVLTERVSILEKLYKGKL